MKRRAFMALLGGAAASAPFVARAQQAGNIRTIGFLGANTASAQGNWTAAFVKRVAELGWIEGRTAAIEYRWVEGHFDRAPELVRELLRLKVDIILTHGTPNVQAASRPLPKSRWCSRWQEIPWVTVWLQASRAPAAM
jgi:putative ABC transport system substrate-binding protein